MPELPEVETIARTLRPQLIGRKILASRCPLGAHRGDAIREEIQRADSGTKDPRGFAPRKISKHSTHGLQSPNTSPYERRFAS